VNGPADLLVEPRGAYILLRRGRKSVALLSVQEARATAWQLLDVADDIAPRTGFEHRYIDTGAGRCGLCGRPANDEHGEHSWVSASKTTSR
jgi:hypothetical protein